DSARRCRKRKATGPRWGRGSEAPPPVEGGDSTAERTDHRDALRAHTDLGDDLGVLGLAHRGEADPVEERLGPVVAGLVDDVHVVEPASACLVDEALDSEASDAATLIVRIDVDPPEDGAEVRLRRLRVEVRADESHDLVTVEHHPLPRGLRVHDGRRDAIGDRREELLLPGLQGQVVDSDDRRGGEFDQSQIRHAPRLTPPGAGATADRQLTAGCRSGILVSRQMPA
ncbi:hypothetical protein ABE10_00585, partial [Bacillus toyonensis]|nr:hypothetical protein [Bacillus toyonensis]